MTTYEKIKEVLDANLKVLTTQIDSNREVMSIQLKEIKEDIVEVKEHVQKTNGHVSANLEKIHILEIDQAQDNRFRKRSWYYVGALSLFVAWEVLSKIFI